MGWNKGNEVCTERDCPMVKLLEGGGGEHYRYQCGSDHIEGYGNTLEFGDDGGSKERPKGNSRWGKLLDNITGGWN